MAQELGLFTARGLRVELSREVGWATIRDKIALGELDAAHAPAGMVLALNLGLGSFQVPCLTGLVLNLHGNAITLSRRLWTAGVRNAESFRQIALGPRSVKPLTFGVAFSSSSHNFLLQHWLRKVGLSPGQDVNLVVVPPPQMAANLKAGNLDGFCVGEPWNSLAVLQRAGWIVELSSETAPRHPEKVLLVRSDFAETRAEEHERLIAALLEACEYCQRAENRKQLSHTLAAEKYLKLRPAIIERSLCGPFHFHADRVERAPDIHIFAGPGVNEPGQDKALWAQESLLETGLIDQAALFTRKRLASIFREDIFRSARNLAFPGVDSPRLATSPD